MCESGAQPDSSCGTV